MLTSLRMYDIILKYFLQKRMKLIEGFSKLFFFANNDVANLQNSKKIKITHWRGPSFIMTLMPNFTEKETCLVFEPLYQEVNKKVLIYD
jgi:hypothetical protein